MYAGYSVAAVRKAAARGQIPGATKTPAGHWRFDRVVFDESLRATGAGAAGYSNCAPEKSQHE